MSSISIGLTKFHYFPKGVGFTSAHARLCLQSLLQASSWEYLESGWFGHHCNSEDVQDRLYESMFSKHKYHRCADFVFDCKYAFCICIDALICLNVSPLMIKRTCLGQYLEKIH